MSEHEGFCLPVLEAMAARQLCPTGSSTGIGQQWYFFDKDFAYLAECLRALLDAPDRLVDIVARQQERARALMRDTDGMAFWNLLLPELRLGQAGLKH